MKLVEARISTAVHFSTSEACFLEDMLSLCEERISNRNSLFDFVLEACRKDIRELNRVKQDREDILRWEFEDKAEGPTLLTPEGKSPCPRI